MILSIITVVYNAVDTIEDTIKSVIGTNTKNIEYVIIDGGSTDGTLKIIEKYQSQLGYFVSEKDNGIYDAMNKAVTKASGNWVYFLGADDVLLPGVLNEVVGRLTDRKTIYYGNVRFKHKNIIYDGRFNSLKLVTRNISHQSIFYPINVFKKHNFNRRYIIFADYDLNLRLFDSKEFKFKYIPLTIAIYNDHGASGLKTQDINFEDDRMAIIRQNFNLFIYLYRYLRTKIVSFYC
ncbi:glycosyltransferase family 2 protein [Mucilaginibacter sp.]|uniref:glycosyltransferase family 2 protein n=1 Tax=Mucilaginibacter sp. TaxID=1882438 RepID=UPI0035BC73C2